jgi:hypothetical protein
MPVGRRERVIAIWLGSTGNGRNPMSNGRRQPSRGGTSRMTRECQVRFCERLGVKFPGPTRQNSNPARTLACPVPPGADLPRVADQLRDKSAESDGVGRIASVLEGVFISHRSARRCSALHSAAAVYHCRRLTKAPATCPCSASRSPVLSAANLNSGCAYFPGSAVALPHTATDARNAIFAFIATTPALDDD